MRQYFASTIFLLNFIVNIECFNVEVTSPKRFTGTNGESFGYAIALHKANNTYWAIVGAPFSNSTGKLTQTLNGAVYRCLINGNSSCINMGIDDTAPGRYQDKKSQMMGATVATFGPNQDIVACAPRFKDTPREKDARPVWLHGRCGIVDGHKFQSGTAFWNPCKGLSNQGNAGFGYCQAGFSATTTTLGTQLLVGSIPGIQQALGRVLVHNVQKIKAGSRWDFLISPHNRLGPGSLMGYAVAWGRFSRSSTFGELAGGAPQGSNGNGKVIIYKLTGTLPLETVIENPDSTMVIGSYFGSVVCAVDLTKDGLSDLVIGAPLYSVITDEGKAYVYVTNAKGVLTLKGTVMGESTINGRFGSSIASAGDLNDDGYNDVVIGAPYGGPDGKGAVYVYHGSENGLGNNFQPVQKIYASTVGGGLMTFGSSLAGGMDIDDNKYPDIVVGSYQSDQVHVFKTKPVLKMKGELTLSSSKIALSTNASTPCRRNGPNIYQCVTMTFCMTYSGKGVPAQLNLGVKFDFDKDQIAGKRAFWLDGSTLKSVKDTNSMLFDANKRRCVTETVYIKENILNILSPIVIAASYSYTEPALGCGPTPCPVADMYHPRTVSVQATYLKDCGSDDICQADLVVTAKGKLPSGQTELVFGLVDTYTLEIDVSNAGENAFLAKMKITFPDDLKAFGVEFVNEPSPLWERQAPKNGTSRVDFNLDSPVTRRQKFKIRVKFTPAKPRPQKNAISFNIEATTVSNDIKPENNRAVVTVPTKLLADLTVSGSAKPDKLFYEDKPRSKTSAIVNETEVGPVITYTFTIQNRGPSPVDGLYARVSLLTQHNSKWLLNLFSVSITGTVSCNLGPRLNPNNYTTLEQQQFSRNRARREAKVTEKEKLVELNCRSATCVTFDCYIGLLNKGGDSTMTLRTRLFQNTFIEEKRGPTKLTSVISVLSPGETNLKQPVNGLPDTAEISVFINPPIKTSTEKAKPIAWWIILLSVLGALLLIIVFVLVLWKAGFFKRKLKGKKITGPTDQDDDFGEY